MSAAAPARLAPESAGARRRRLLLVLHDDQEAGSSRLVLNLVPLLERLGWEVALWAPRPSTVFDEWRAAGRLVGGAPRLARYSWRTLRHPPGVRKRLVGVARSLVAFRRFLRSVAPDVVHANTLHSLFEAMVARAAGTPVVVHSHEMPPPGAKALLARSAAWLVGNEVVAVSEASAAVLAHGNRRPRVVHVASSIPEAPSRRLRRPSDPVVVGSIGVISSRKGSDVFVAAAERLKALGQDLDVRLVGSIKDGPAAAWARQVVERARAAQVGYRERVNVAEELRDWDIFVLPARVDPFPLVVLEAMASCVAVIGSDVDGIPEQVGPDAGILVPTDDPETLAASIAELARDPVRRAALGAAGRARVTGRFTLERTAEGMHDAYLSAIDKRS